MQSKRKSSKLPFLSDLQYEEEKEENILMRSDLLLLPLNSPESKMVATIRKSDISFRIQED